MSDVLRVAVAGLGTVGAGVLGILHEQAAHLARRCGRRIEVTAVSARDRSKDRGVPLEGMAWFDDPVALAREASADVVVELIGGADGVAKAICETALSRGLGVVTANKALMAEHGQALAALAKTNNAPLAYEAAVAGGIPIIKTLREGLVANQIGAVVGILNGTCNYILTAMQTSGRAFEDVLAEAQALGYAEADPAADVDGFDTAHKLALLAALAFGTAIRFDGVHVEGIRAITAEDMAYAEELGFRIKLLGIASYGLQGLSQRVHPAMVPAEDALAHVDDVYNAVVLHGDSVGRVMIEGRGAGAGPTASAVVADLVDLAFGRDVPVLGLADGQAPSPRLQPMAALASAFYLRMTVHDETGVLAVIADVLSRHGISVSTVLQRKHEPGSSVPLVFVTHKTSEAAIDAALSEIDALGVSTAAPNLIRIVQVP